MNKLYAISGGGQKIQENVFLGHTTYYEEIDSSEILRHPGVRFFDGFADTIWAEDLSKLQELANEWVGEQVDLIKK